MSKISFLLEKYAENGVVIVSDYEIGQALDGSCNIRNSKAACRRIAVHIGEAAMDGSSLVTFECVSVCGVDPDRVKEKLDKKANLAKREHSGEVETPKPVVHTEEWVGIDETA